MRKRAFGLSVGIIAVIVIGLPILQITAEVDGISLLHWILPTSLITLFIMSAPFIFYYKLGKNKIYNWRILLLRQKIGLVLFSIVAIGLPTINSIFWIFDINGYATSSSTSALAFLFVTFYVLVFSIVPILLMRDDSNKKSR